MQIILVSRHLKVARTVTIMPRHVAMAAIAFVALVLSVAMLLSWLSVQFRLPVVEDLLASLHLRETQKNRVYLDNNLQLMANRIGELQARVMALDVVSDRLAGHGGDAAVSSSAQGGPFLPVQLSPESLQAEIDRLAHAIDAKSDQLEGVAASQLAKRVSERLLPTTLPVARAELGSPFGQRTDPIVGARAMHEGIDFNAEVGTPVVAAAEGVVLSASFHPDFGNLVEIDHGEGLVSRYAHLSRIDVQSGILIKRGERLGALGSTGRSTGPHLHFEVRQNGVPQNPARFLQKNDAFAQLKRR